MNQRRDFTFDEILHTPGGSYSIPHDLAQAIWAYAQANDVYNKVFDRFLAKADIKITASEWFILRLVLSSPGPISLTYIARRLAMLIQSVSQLLNKLEKRGLVRRVRSKEDKRVVNIFVTQKGFDLLKELTPYTYEFIKETTGMLSKAEIESLHLISRKIRDNCMRLMGIDPSETDAILDRLADMISDEKKTS